MTMTNLSLLLGSLIAALPALAAADPAVPGTSKTWTVGVAPRVGVTVPTSSLGAMAVGGLAVDVPLPIAKRQLVIALDASITRPTHDGSLMDDRINGAGSYDVKVTELKLGLDVIYRVFGPERRLIPFVGAGPVLHMLKTSETTTFAPGTNTSQNSELGFEIVGGADFRAGPGYVLGELRAVYSKLDHPLTGESNAGNVMLAAGYRAVF
jgi:hypothetical protein